MDNKANGRFRWLAGMGMAQPWWYSLPQSGVPSGAIRVRRQVCQGCLGISLAATVEERLNYASRDRPPHLQGWNGEGPRYGLYTKEAIEERRFFRELVREARETLALGSRDPE